MGKTALVLIDVQNAFINQNTDSVLLNIQGFLRSYANRFDYVFGTEYVNNPETACYKFEGWKYCMEGTYEACIVESIQEYLDDVFPKSKYSCWNDVFRGYLRKNDIDKIYFCGFNTGCCVLHSAFDAYNDVFDCYVISDLCGSMTGISSHYMALGVLSECITPGRVITTSNLIKKISSLGE